MRSIFCILSLSFQGIYCQILTKKTKGSQVSMYCRSKQSDVGNAMAINQRCRYLCCVEVEVFGACDRKEEGVCNK